MMRLATDDTDATLLLTEPLEETWPAEADMILSAMRAGSRPAVDRRGKDRREIRCRADLRLFAHSPLSAPIALYTRDVTPAGIGFITQQRLALGYSGLVRVCVDHENVITAACRVYRCREAIGGWYEGALHFTKRQPDLS